MKRAALLVLLSIHGGCLAAEESSGQRLEEMRVVDATGSVRQIGTGYENRFDRPPRSEATNRLESFKKRQSPTELREFLGAQIDYVAITHIEGGLNFDKAQALVRAALRSNVVWPQYTAGPSLTRGWSESTPANVSSRVCFRHPKWDTPGIVSGCGVLELSSPYYLFFQDAFGISWWYRIPPDVARKLQGN